MQKWVKVLMQVIERCFTLDKEYSFVYNTGGWKDQLLQIDIGGKE